MYWGGGGWGGVVCTRRGGGGVVCTGSVGGCRNVQCMVGGDVVVGGTLVRWSVVLIGWFVVCV